MGAGVGDKLYEFDTLTNLYQIQKAEKEAGSGLVKEQNIYATLTKLSESLGLQDVDKYFNNPSENEEEQPVIDPAQEMQMQEMQRIAEKEEREEIRKDKEQQLKEFVETEKLNIEKQKLSIEANVQLKNAQLDADKINLEEIKANGFN